MRELMIRDAIREALDEEMARDDRVYLMGEDVGANGGTFKCSAGLWEKYGDLRCKDSPISEQGFVGMGVGAALTGLRPIVEIMFADFMKGMFKSSLTTKLGYLTVKGQVDGFKKVFSPDEIGGTALVGISKPVIKAHGSSNGYAIYNAICRAKEMAESDLIDDITANVDHMRLAAGGSED